MGGLVYCNISFVQFRLSNFGLCQGVDEVEYLDIPPKSNEDREQKGQHELCKTYVIVH
jgi:hypothetical protein